MYQSQCGDDTFVLQVEVVLADLMGQSALVVEAGVTAQGAVEEALATIETCPVVGVILNKADERRAGGYGYGYGYGNGSN